MATKKNPNTGYKKDQLLERAIKATADKDCVFVADVIAALGISAQTMYRHFPKNSDELEHIKEKLNDNRASKKKSLRKQWASADASASLQISLYKLLADKDELARLNGAGYIEDEAHKDTIDMRPKRLADTHED